MPPFGKPERLRRFIHHKISAALPALAFAYGAEDRPQRIGNVVDLGDADIHGMFQRKYVLLALARGDVPANSAITRKDAGCVELGLAAHARPDLLAGVIEPAQLQIPEW